MFTTSFHCSCLFLGMWWSWSKFAFIECEFDFQNSLNANANSGIYILIIPILWVWPAPEWSTPGCQSICIYVWEVGDWTATSDCDVSSLLYTHFITALLQHPIQLHASCTSCWQTARQTIYHIKGLSPYRYLQDRGPRLFCFPTS